jgi:hypothetical protein
MACENEVRKTQEFSVEGEKSENARITRIVPGQLIEILPSQDATSVFAV